jgi:cytochrome c-type biogenesis protein CcmH/NrfF
VALHTIDGKDELVTRVLWLSPTVTVLLVAASLWSAARRDPRTDQ